MSRESTQFRVPAGGELPAAALRGRLQPVQEAHRCLRVKPVIRLIRFPAIAILAVLAAPALGQAAEAPVVPWTVPAAENFAYGVSSGEVSQRSAMLWARAGRAGKGSVEIATDPAFRKVKLRRAVDATAANDTTMMATVRGLRPGTRYWYRFTLDGTTSDTGAFRTASPSGSSAPVRFAFSGDAQASIQPSTGKPFFNDFEVFDRMVEEKNDFNVLQGDTIYSDTQIGGRIEGVELIAPWTAYSVAEKWATYRQNLATAPMARFRGAATLYSHWDDHEFINNFTRGDDGEPLFNAGREAFLDYTPVRWKKGTGLYRKVGWGRNLDVFFLDQSSFRSKMAEQDCISPITGNPDPAPSDVQEMRQQFAGLVPALGGPITDRCKAALADPKRTMLGPAQYKRFLADIRASKARFKVVMVQGPISQLVINSFDRWEAYSYERTRLLRALEKESPKGLIFLTTDIHANTVGTVRYKTLGKGAPDNTPFTEVSVGPIAATTHKNQIGGSVGLPNAGDLVRDAFYLPKPPKGVGLRCAAIDTYAYGQVSVSSRQLKVEMKDLNGKPVLGADGKPCAPVVIRPGN